MATYSHSLSCWDDGTQHTVSEATTERENKKKQTKGRGNSYDIIQNTCIYMCTDIEIYMYGGDRDIRAAKTLVTKWHELPA